MNKSKIEDSGSNIATCRPRLSIFHPRYLLLVAVLLALFHAALASALEVPPLKGRVNDHAGLLPSARAQALEQRLAQFESQTGHQIAVLTIPSLQDDALESFSIRVAENWKIGKKGFDNGVILLIAQNDRKLRIEVGYGLEGVLPDAIASRIIREVIVPRFRENNFAGGVEAGVEAIIKVTSGEPLPPPARTTRKGTGFPLSIVILLAFLGLLTLQRLAWLNSRRGWNGWSSGGHGGYGGWGGGGFGGGGGFSGGGGGFGGGGASGGW